MNEFFEADGFDHVRVHAEVVTVHQVLFLARGGEHNDGNAAQFFRSANNAEHLQAVDLGKFEVEEHDGRVSFLTIGPGSLAQQVVQSLLTVSCRDHVIGQVGTFKSHQGQFQVFRIVFDEQDGFKHSYSP